MLTEAVACLVAGVCLLARPGSLGGGPVRRAVAQLRGTGGQPKTVPPLLLIGVLFLWEELFGQDLWFGTPWQPGFTPMMLVALLIVAAGVAAVVWLPRAAAVLAVAGTVLIGLIGVIVRGAVALGSRIRAGRAVERLHGRLLRRGAARRRDHPGCSPGWRGSRW